jgi:beta-phosphoglucomutase-like phosphatase (HAD superfamily)
VTCYENMHATKAHPAYYREILAQLGRQPDECLMVGDHWDWDITQAASVGIPVYWIAEPDASPPSLLPHSTSPSLPARRRDEKGVLVGQGTLTDLWDWIKKSEDGRGGGARGHGTKR